MQIYVMDYCPDNTNTIRNAFTFMYAKSPPRQAALVRKTSDVTPNNDKRRVLVFVTVQQGTAYGWTSTVADLSGAFDMGSTRKRRASVSKLPA